MTGGEASTGGTRKIISPYDITSLDNPGLSITQVQLKEDNYNEWARSIRTALRARKKFGFVDGTIKQPDEKSEDLEDWWTINSLLVSWIRNTIEPTLRSTISHMEVVEDLWNDLKDHFSVTNEPQIQPLKSDLADCKQRGLTIMEYYGQLKQLWDELGNFKQLPTCKCGKCTCNLARFWRRNEGKKKSTHFLWDWTRMSSELQDPIS